MAWREELKDLDLSLPLCHSVHILSPSGVGSFGCFCGGTPRYRVRGLWCCVCRASAPVAHLRLLCGPSNLVDPASSHMLVSKIKPCMSQCKFLYGRTVNGSLKQL